MAWDENKWRGESFKQYKITKAQYVKLFQFAGMSGKTTDEKNKLVREFWAELGKAQGFNPLSMSRLNGRQLTFDAVPE